MIRMQRIYASMENPEELEKEPYKLSQRNSPEYRELRKFLLDLHNDEKIAEYISSKNILGSLGVYDPDPNEETSWYLGINSKSKKTDFIYQHSAWGIGRGGESVPFELIEGRFYANGTELVDIFPELTADKLEHFMKKSLSDMRRQ